MARYDAEAYSVGLAMRLGLPVTAVATIGTALRAAHKAGAEEMRERAAVVCDTQPIQDDGSEAAPGPGYERGWLSANARSAHTIRALPTEPGEEAGT